jgi:hypothetical protein
VLECGSAIEPEAGNHRHLTGKAIIAARHNGSQIIWQT